MYSSRLRSQAFANIVGLLPLAIVGTFLSGCGGSAGGNSSTVGGVGTGSSSTILTITTASLPNGQLNAPYSFTLSATGGSAPYTWSLSSGTLPAGLSLSASSGAIAGIPTAAVNATSLTLTVSDSSHPVSTATASLTLTVLPAPLAITTPSLPNGKVDTLYSAVLSATGGTSPYTWSLITGTLPTGLSLNAASGAITGIPSAVVANVPLTFMVSDSDHPALTARVNLALTVSPVSLAITTKSLPNGQVNTPYSATLSARGGSKPYAWSLTSGALPQGFSVNSSAGTISGTASGTAASTSLTFTVTDSSSPALTATATLTLTVFPAPLVITTAALPSAQLNAPYSATLTATGGTSPYAWSVASGTLPAGLSLATSSGTISGTPSVEMAGTSLIFDVTDSGTPMQTKSVSLPLTVVGPNANVSISPVRAALTVGQALSVSATTSDGSGVTWSATGGSFSSTTSSTGAAVTYTAPSSAGSYTITATSVSDVTRSASSDIFITDLAGVYTYHNDLARDGANTREYGLTPTSVGTLTFGKLSSCAVDGAVYAQPLWVSNLATNGGTHNVVFVASQHDSLYAFDADANQCAELWEVSLIDTAHGGTGNETSVPGNLVGLGLEDIAPEVGVTGTPVIDPSTNTLYVVSKSVDPSGPTFYQRLHAIDVTSGSEKFGGPHNITSSVTFPGTGDGGSTVSFNPKQQNQRAGLALVNGVVYVAWGSHEDAPPYYGWVVGFDASSLNVRNILNVSPNVQFGGIWMAGGAPSADANNNLYLITGNAIFDANNASAPNNDYGDSFLQLSSDLAISSYFTPSDQQDDAADDGDFGSGGAAVVVNLTSGTLKHIVIGGGKDGNLYVLNGDSMGGLGDANARQEFTVGNAILATSAFWNNNLYVAGIRLPLASYSFNSSTNLFNTSIASQSPTSFGFPGSTPSVSSLGPSNGVVWALDNSTYCTNQSPSCGPAVLHAYDAINLANELWNSTQLSSDVAGNAIKFTVPTVANGKVYIGTRGDNTGGSDSSTSIPGELDVYGLKPN